jgi:hypothetical protein
MQNNGRKLGRQGVQALINMSFIESDEERKAPSVETDSARLYMSTGGLRHQSEFSSFSQVSVSEFATEPSGNKSSVMSVDQDLRSLGEGRSSSKLVVRVRTTLATSQRYRGVHRPAGTARAMHT